MDPREIERVAEGILLDAGLDPALPVRLLPLASALGIEVVRSSSAPFPGDAAIARIGPIWRAYLRPQLPLSRARFAIAHEIAEWWLWLHGFHRPETEDIANRLGAALLAPRRRFVSLVRALPTVQDLALELEVTESMAALRTGEVTGRPMALVARTVRLRGDEWAWPPEQELRAAMRGPVPKGLVKVALSDRSRLVLRAAEGA